MKVEIWSDILCPWCYVGKREFEKALGNFKHKNNVEVVWHSFLLDPGAKLDHEDDIYNIIANKYGITREKSILMHENLKKRASSAGLEYHFEILKATNSFNAHRLVQLAAKHGRQN